MRVVKDARAVTGPALAVDYNPAPLAKDKDLEARQAVVPYPIPYIDTPGTKGGSIFATVIRSKGSKFIEFIQHYQ